jgi:hypothetical protein
MIETGRDSNDIRQPDYLDWLQAPDSGAIAQDAVEVFSPGGNRSIRVDFQAVAEAGRNSRAGGGQGSKKGKKEKGGGNPSQSQGMVLHFWPGYH